MSSRFEFGKFSGAFLSFNVKHWISIVEITCSIFVFSMASLARYFSAVFAPQECFFVICPSPTSHNTAVKCTHLCMPDVWRLCSPIRHSVVAAKFHVVLRWYFRYSADPPGTNNPYVSPCVKDRKVTSLLKKFNTIIFRNIFQMSNDLAYIEKEHIRYSWLSSSAL